MSCANLHDPSSPRSFCCSLIYDLEMIAITFRTGRVCTMRPTTSSVLADTKCKSQDTEQFNAIQKKEFAIDRVFTMELQHWSIRVYSGYTNSQKEYYSFAVSEDKTDTGPDTSFLISLDRRVFSCSGSCTRM